MRRLKRISFFLYSCLLFAVGFYGHYKIEQWFYPGRQAIISQNEIPFFQMQSATQAVSVPDRLRADTKLVVKNTDQVSRRQTEEIKSLPLRLIGCSRKEVEDEIRHYQDAPPPYRTAAGASPDGAGFFFPTADCCFQNIPKTTAGRNLLFTD